jgi:hypothetical protein
MTSHYGLGVLCLLAALSTLGAGCVEFREQPLGTNPGDVGADPEEVDAGAQEDMETVEDVPTGPPPCAAGQQRCGGRCVSLEEDPSHCGGCNRGCTGINGIPICRGGQCAVSCNAGRGDCDSLVENGCEVDLDSTAQHCGACNRACDPSETCQGGVCVCSAGLTRCGAGCANIQSSNEHCGGCGNACVSSNGVPTCSAGVCTVACASGSANCDNNIANGCEVDTRSNADHCGRCGQRCPTPTGGGTRGCSNGTCVSTCPTGYLTCGGTCVDARSPCSVGTGACRRTGSVVCSGASGGCSVMQGSGSSEVCNGIDDDCDGVVDDGAGNQCPLATRAATMVCVAGGCAVGTCQANYANCDGNNANGCETYLLSNSTHCGRCNNNCVSPLSCVNTSCTSQCPPDEPNLCGGVCVDFSSDNRNCGRCGTTCTTTRECINRQCVLRQP